MAEADAKKKNQSPSAEQQGAQQGAQQGGQQRQTNQSSGQPSGAMQTRGQGQQRGGIQRRGSSFPSLFALSPRDLLSANPFELMRRFTEEMDRAFGDFGLTRGGGGQTAMWVPNVEVFERDNHLIVRAELPGVNNEDVRVELTDAGLVIQGERKSEHEERREGVYLSERSYGEFYRLIPLPEDAQADQAQARFNNGVLEISIPLAESQQRRRSIPIETGGGQTRQTTGGQAQTATGGSSRK